jgi:hypothetical protein
VLFVFSLLTLPPFLFLTGEKRKNLVQCLVTFLKRPLMVYLLVVPFAAVEVLVSRDPGGIGMRAFGGWSVFTYLVIFILGFFLGLHTDILETLKRCRFISFFLAVSALIVGIVLLESGISYNGVVMSVMRSLNTWCWLLTFLGFAARYLNFQNRFLSYANRAVLPFYILHQTIIIAVGFLILNWAAGLLVKGSVLIILSFLVIMALYNFIIKRFRWSRILFGMKGKQ